MRLEDTIIPPPSFMNSFQLDRDISCNMEQQANSCTRKRMRKELSDLGPSYPELRKRMSPKQDNRSSVTQTGPISKQCFAKHNQESPIVKRRRRYLALKVAPAWSSVSANSHKASEKIVVTGKIQHFRKIQNSKVQLVVWRRSSIPSFMAALSDPQLPAYVLPKLKCVIEPNQLAQALKRKTIKLAKSIGQSKTNELIQDICLLTKEFAAATKTHKVALKLEHFGDNGCQYWHQDSVPYRLVATYRGPCTEWVHPDHGDAALRRRQDNSRHKQTFAHNDIPLFKGRGVSNSRDNTLLKHPGIVHRSPRILGSRIHRLVLVLDLPSSCC
jgi:hypothetical protein